MLTNTPYCSPRSDRLVRVQGVAARVAGDKDGSDRDGDEVDVSDGLCGGGWGRTHCNRGAAQHRVHDASEQAGYKKKHELERTPVAFELGAELGDAGVKRLSLGELGELDAELGAAGVKASGMPNAVSASA